MFVVFEQYQKSRTTFVQTVAELASRPQNIETLQNAGKMNSEGRIIKNNSIKTQNLAI